MSRRVSSTCRSVLLSAMLLTAASASTGMAGCLGDPPVCSATISSGGEVGLTSYRGLPFASQVHQYAWGASPDLAPAQLFWEEGAHFTNAETMAVAQRVAADLTSRAIVPHGNSQLWEGTFQAAQPPGAFPKEPDWIKAERASFRLTDAPEFSAWVDWHRQRPQLFIRGSDGGSMPPAYRSWGGSWGHVSPLMPLPRADWPPSMPDARYGDWYAYRWAQTAERSGNYAILLSDFVDSQPHAPSWQQGFNQELIDLFGRSIGRPIPGGDVPSQASFITSQLMAKWNDFLARGYVDFYARLKEQLSLRTGHPALIINQCSVWPSARRFLGTDHRIIARVLPRAHYMCIWDGHTMREERRGEPMIFALGGAVVDAAREPNNRNGGNLGADHPDFWAAARKFWGHLSAEEQRERGLKELKRVWLEMAWAHIATRSGKTRRALAWMSRSYWDNGKLDPTLERLIQTIVPTRSFGPAIYYSSHAERRLEAQVPAQLYLDATYLHPSKIVSFKNGGGVANYYVSDAALPSLRPAARPTAWIVLDRPDLMSDSERQKLLRIAPIFTSLESARSSPTSPLVFSDGLTGTGFYDQASRLIVTVSNIEDEDERGFVSLRNLSSGSYTARDLFTDLLTDLEVVDGRVSIPVLVSRWDTRAFAISRR